MLGFGNLNNGSPPYNRGLFELLARWLYAMYLNRSPNSRVDGGASEDDGVMLDC